MYISPQSRYRPFSLQRYLIPVQSVPTPVSGKHPSDVCYCRLVLPVLEYHRNILLITMKFLRFIHVVACISSSEFFRLGTVDILDRIILCLGDCPVHCGLFSSIPDRCPLEAISTPLPISKNQKCLQMLPNVQQGTKSPPYTG